MRLCAKKLKSFGAGFFNQVSISRKPLQFVQFVRFQSVPSLPHFTLYSSDSDLNFNSNINNDENNFELELDSREVVQILQDLKLELVDALIFFKKLREKGFQHDTTTYLAMIKVLCYWGEHKKLDSLFKEMILNLKVDNSEMFEAMAEELSPNSLVRAFDTLIKSYASLEMFDEATVTLFEATRRGIGPCLLSCNFLMNMLVRHRKEESAIAIYKVLKNVGLEPNVYTYGVAVKAYCRRGSLESLIDAAEVFREMEEAGVVPNSFTYAPYLEGLCAIGQSYLAYRELLDLRARNVVVDAYAYNTVIQGFVREKRLEEAAEVFKEMEEAGVVPDEVSYHALIRGCCGRGDLERAVAIHKEMESKGIKTNCLILSSFLQCLCLKGRQSEAVELFDDFKKSGNVFLDEVVYNVAIDAYCRMGKLDEAKRLFDEMKVKKLVLDVKHYTTLIDGHCLNGNMIDALDLFVEMKTSGVRVDDIAYNVLARGLCRKGLSPGALLEDMKRQGLTPSRVTHHMIIEGLCFAESVEHAERYFSKLKEEEEKSIEVCSSMVNGYCESGNADEGLNLFCRLCSKKILINRNSCARLLAALCRAGDMEKARQAFDTMVASGLTPDVVIYTIMVNGYCHVNHLQKASDLQHAVSLFVGMIEKGLEPDAVTYTALISGYCRQGDMDKVSSLVRMMLSNGIRPDILTMATLDRGIVMAKKVQFRH